MGTGSCLPSFHRPKEAGPLGPAHTGRSGPLCLIRSPDPFHSLQSVYWAFYKAPSRSDGLGAGQTHSFSRPFARTDRDEGVRSCHPRIGLWANPFACAGMNSQERETLGGALGGGPLRAGMQSGRSVRSRQRPRRTRARGDKNRICGPVPSLPGDGSGCGASLLAAHSKHSISSLVVDAVLDVL